MLASEFCFYCRHPATASPFFTADPHGHFFIQEVPVYSGLPAWPACADLLVDTDTSELIGLSYQVPLNRLRTAERTCANLDPRAIRLLAPDADEMKIRYGGEYGEIGRLEVVWSPRPSVSVRFLELMEPLWYYSQEGQPGLPYEELVAVGISTFDDLLSEYSLAAPKWCLGDP